MHGPPYGSGGTTHVRCEVLLVTQADLEYSAGRSSEQARVLYARLNEGRQTVVG